MKPDSSPSPFSFVVSRCDRLGDLVLSLPVLGLLADAGIKDRVLHCGSYTADVGRWALHNGLCTRLWIDGESPPSGLESSVGLSLFHSAVTTQAFRRAGLKVTMGPRSRLSSLWSYKKSVPQHRSRVLMSEMRYNWELGATALRWLGVKVPAFRGLPALQLLPGWRSPVESPDLVVAVSNNGSAANWPLENYMKLAQEALRNGKSVDFLVSGLDAAERAEKIRQSGLIDPHATHLVVEGKARLIPTFASVSNLITYLARSRRVLASSTGTLHLAHAAGVSVLGVYPESPIQETFARWRPDGYWHNSPVRYITF